MVSRSCSSILSARVPALLLALAWGGCDCGGESVEETPDGGTRDSGVTTDGPVADAAIIDTRGTDTTTADTRAADVGGTDAGGSDTRGSDTGAADTGGTDTGAADTGNSDSGAPDTIGTDTDPPGNQPPEVEVADAVGLWPGDTIAIPSEVTDSDGDPVSCAWSWVNDLPDGVSVEQACDGPLMAVDREVYEGGPADLVLSLTLTADDGVNPPVAETVEVTIRDERGGHVSNLPSSFSGTGYAEDGARHGYCGAVGHPCGDFVDAQVNLRAAIEEGVEIEPLLRVATTGTDYILDAPLLLDDDGGRSDVALSLECGFEPSTWDKPANAWVRTPLRYRGAIGVHIRADGVRLEGCDIQGDQPLLEEEERFAVYVEEAEVEIADCTLIGVPEAVAPHPLLAVGLRLEMSSFDDTRRSMVRDSEIEGGFATFGVAGIDCTGGLPVITGNRVRGGSAPEVVGINMYVTSEATVEQVEIAQNPVIEGGVSVGAGATRIQAIIFRGGSATISDNPRIVGCTGACVATQSVGILANEQGGSSYITVERNTVYGNIGSAELPVAVGVIASGRTVLGDNTIQGGLGRRVFGVSVSEGPCSLTGGRVTGGSAYGLDPLGPEDGTAIGVLVAEDATARFHGVTLQGASSTPVHLPLTAVGLLLESDSGEVRVEGGELRSGPAQRSAYGVDIAPGAGALTLEDVTVSADDAVDEIDSESVGLRHAGDSLTVSGGSVTAGAAVVSIGVQDLYAPMEDVGAGMTELLNTTVASGAALEDSAGLFHLSGLLTVSASTFHGGPAEDLSAGVYLFCQEAVSRAGPHDLSDVTATGGSARLSVGFTSDACADVTVIDSTFEALAVGADEAYGLRVGGARPSLDRVNAAAGDAETKSIGAELTGGVSATDLVATAGSALSSVGLYLVDAGGSSIEGGRAEAGSCAGDALGIGDSLGAMAYGNIDKITVTGMELVAGDGCDRSMGFIISNSCYLCRLIQSSARAGTAVSLSAGVWLNGNCQTCELDRNVIRGGDTTGIGAEVRSVGLRTYFDGPWGSDPEYATYVTNNRIYGGVSNNARGWEASGNPGDDLRILHNNIDAEGRSGTGSRSMGVAAGQDRAGDADVVGTMSGNIVGAGVGESALHIYEYCVPFVDTSASLYRSWSNAFWPAIDGGDDPVAYVRLANPADCSLSENLTTLAAVNAAPRFGNSSPDEQSFEGDPGFAADGYHLAPGSPLIDVARSSYTLWPFESGSVPRAFVDVDGEERPDHGISYHDIGCDEVYP